MAGGMKEDAASWSPFVSSLISRGLTGVRLVAGDRCADLADTVGELLPEARHQRCMAHVMRSILSKVSRRHAKWAADASKAVFASQTRQAALAKARSVARQMEHRKLKEAAACLREGIGETTTHLLDDYPGGHRRRIRTNTMIERLNHGIRRRTRVVGSLPDGQSALMPITATIRYVTGRQRPTRRHLDMSRLDDTMNTANRKRTQTGKN